MTKQIDVLDRGFVRLVEEPNSDLKVVNAARVSFGKKSEWGPDGKLTDRDARLLKYLKDHNHWTPFAHCRELRILPVSFKASSQKLVFDVLNSGGAFVKDATLSYYISCSWAHFHSFPWLKDLEGGEPTWSVWPEQRPVTLHIKMPIFVARQLMRSNVGIAYNEISRRYVDDPPEFHIPSEWRSPPTGSIKQGSGGPIDKTMNDNYLQIYKEAVTASEMAYDHFIGGLPRVAPEQARIILPQSMYTEVWMTATTEALSRVLGLRLDPHAQWEIRQYAEAISTLTGIDPRKEPVTND